MSKRKKPSAADYNAMGWMHLYPQHREHGSAEIRGTKEALIALRNALTEAINHGTSHAAVTATDGEGYHIEIRRINVLNLLGPLPYYGDAGWGERSPDWSRAPEPFDPDIHRVMFYVDADGGVTEAPPIQAGTSLGDRGEGV